MGLAGVKIILVEPAGPMNVGSVARVMKNFGLDRLVLVNPQCDHLGTEAQQMAVHAKDILKSSVTVTTLPEALTGCIKAVATIGRDLSWETPVDTPRTTIPWLMETSGQSVALIFGREDRGLTNEELNYAQKFLRIPTDAGYPSMNLATAVAVCCYELSQNLDEKNVNADISLSGENELAPLDAVESYYQQLEYLLLTIGYLHPHTALSRMSKFRQLYSRAQLQTNEIAMLRGILRQIQWAISNDRPS